VEDHRISRAPPQSHAGHVAYSTPTPPRPSGPQIGASAPRRWRTTASPRLLANPTPVMSHTPALEMRSSLSAEPGTGDGDPRPSQPLPVPAAPRSALARLGGGGSPHLQGFPPIPRLDALVPVPSSYKSTLKRSDHAIDPRLILPLFPSPFARLSGITDQPQMATKSIMPHKRNPLKNTSLIMESRKNWDYSLFCGIMSSPPKWKRMLFL
jgi:hypothetical protein